MHTKISPHHTKMTVNKKAKHKRSADEEESRDLHSDAGNGN